MDQDRIGPYDALVLLSFGGPDGPEDVVPFLENVTRGRGIPKERLAEVGQHYFGFGGKSPINDQNKALLAAIRKDFDDHGIDINLYWGNRNWDPYLTDVLAQAAADGVRRIAVFTTSAYSSYSSCRQYRENLWESTVATSAEVLEVDRLRSYYNHPGFVEPFVDGVLTALSDLESDLDRPRAQPARLVFVTHSIPTAMNDASGPPPDHGAYLSQHRDVVATVANRVAAATGVDREVDLVFCSRSGSPQIPWLEPDVNDHLESLADQGVDAVVLVPIGFVSDHMEVIYDLDTEAMATCARLGIEARRSPTPGTDPRFVAMVRDLLLERAAAERGEEPHRMAVGAGEALWDRCDPRCCINGRSPETPALCGSEAGR